MLVGVTGAARAEVGLAPLLAGLSLATDLAMGQPAGHAARTCLLATRLAERLGLSPGQRADTFYVGLLRYVGCTADAHEMAAFAGDEIALAVGLAPFVMGEQDEEAVALGRPDAGHMVAEAKAAALAVHCEAARMLAGRLGLGPGVVDALRHGFERFDGTGHPAGLAEDAVPVPVRVCVLARDVEVWRSRADRATVCEIVRRRRGRAYDPRVADAFLDDERAVVEQLDEDTWEQVFAAEPHPVRVPADELDGLLEVVADFADLKLPCALGHSRGVARLAADAADACGLDSAAVTRLRHAGLLHDLGRVGVGNMVWERPGPLSGEEWERVRLHPYLTERVLARTPPLRHLAPLAGAHHERLDGSGYHRASSGRSLDIEARILAAADARQAMTQDRPHRPRLGPDEAARELDAEVAAGRLDRRAVAAVRTVAGRRPARIPAGWPAGLTDREVEVLRLTCRGLSNRQVATRLVLSVKTVGRHLENIYGKAGVSSRAAAALFAVRHELLDEPGMG